MKINYEKLQKEAIQCKLSVYYLIKKKLNYRVSKNNNKFCGNCMNIKKIFIKKNCIQCSVIGESIDPYSDIEMNYICNNYRRNNERV